MTCVKGQNKEKSPVVKMAGKHLSSLIKTINIYTGAIIRMAAVYETVQNNTKLGQRRHLAMLLKIKKKKKRKIYWLCKSKRMIAHDFQEKDCQLLSLLNLKYFFF